MSFACGLIPTNVYVHIALTYAPDVGTFTAFIDGAVIGTKTDALPTYALYDNWRGECSLVRTCERGCRACAHPEYSGAR
jgi:hypothetical protein